MNEATFYPRFAERPLVQALDDSPVVLIHGPRQCGKTTLAQHVCVPELLTWRGGNLIWRGKPLSWAKPRPRDYTYVSFDDDVVRAGAEADPIGFVADLPARVILDEVQRVPELFNAIKMAVDRDRVPGRFVLTGSTNVLLVPKLSDSLAGRMQVVRLHPLAQCELKGPVTLGQLPGFLDALFGSGFKTGRTKRMGFELAERIASGGYPAALVRPTDRRRTNWYRDYLDALVQRDVRDLARIGSLETLPRLLAVAASQTARLFSLADLAAPFQLSRPTIRNYVTLLEQVFLLEQLPPWHSNRLSRLVKTPKLHLCDTGLACALLGANATDLAADRSLLGQLLETFVFQELKRQASWHDEPMSFFHFRDRDGVEVDIVIERGAQAVAGVEVKASATVTAKDFRALRKLKNAVGRRFVAGVVLYDGEATASFGGGLYAIPIRLLWETLVVRGAQ